MPHTPICHTRLFATHALKGQKLLAQGNALGMDRCGNTPCKGKSFKTYSDTGRFYAATPGVP